jgi:uncharacterized membrane protein
MFEDLPIQFEEPGWLLLLLLLIPTWVIALVHGGALSRTRRILTLSVRAVLILLLSMALARPSWVERGESLTVTVISDVSRSIPMDQRVRAASLVQELLKNKSEPDDRIASVGLATDAQPSAKPHPETIVNLDAYDGVRTATDLAAGVEQALSLLPVDTANRLLLISDGNQTRGNVLEAAELARANGIPIDVIPIRYEYQNEVLVESVKVPTRARLGQTADLKIFFRSQNATSGRLRVLQNDIPIILDPDSGATTVSVSLPAGPEVLSFPISLDQGGAHRFRALFEPDDPAADGLLENNRGDAVTFVAGDGRVLVIEGMPDEGSALTRALRQGGIEVEVRTTDALSIGPEYLNGFDAVVLANVPRWSIDNLADSALRSYVHDLGGGLLMLGGNASFGAGGWIDSQTAKALPVRLDPPQQRQMVRGALALIMHSTEMPRANFWAQQTAIAAIEALTSLDYIGIVTYNWGGAGPSYNGSSWALPMQEAGDKQAAFAAAKSMTVGDMPDFQSSLELGFDGLEPLAAGQKHMIIISDGDPNPPTSGLIQKYIDAKITITTIMYAGHGTAIHRQNMRVIAEATGGRFYNAPSPKNLPKIFNKEASVVSRSLISEGDFTPIVSPSVTGPTKGIGDVPNIRGYVLTVPREGAAAEIPMTVLSSEGADPLYAYWNYGLGKSVAFTSDLSGRWGAAWTGWSGFQRMWEQTVRWLMRPASPSNVLVRTQTEGETAIIELEASEDDSGFINYLQTDARILAPDGSVERLELQQVGPGRYRGEFPATDAGAYLVNVGFPVRGTDGEVVVRNVQGAVSVPYAKEFRAVRDNGALLSTIADRTGGRVIEIETIPDSIDLFERGELEIPLAPKRVWDLLAIIAAGLFLLDVATRRLTFDTRSAREAAARAVARTEEASEASVDAWKRARTQARRGKRRPEAGAKTEQPVGDSGPAPTDATASTEFDVASELSGEARTTPDPPTSAPDRSVPDSGESSLDRLKRAKRRATGEEEDAS